MDITSNPISGEEESRNAISPPLEIELGVEMETPDKSLRVDQRPVR